MSTTQYFDGTPEERAAKVAEVERITNAWYASPHNTPPKFAESYVPPCKPEPKRITTEEFGDVVWYEGGMYHWLVGGRGNVRSTPRFYDVSFSIAITDDECRAILALAQEANNAG